MISSKNMQHAQDLLERCEDMKLLEQAIAIKEAAPVLMNAASEQKNELLSLIIEELAAQEVNILKANEEDIKEAQLHDMPANRIDRMMFNHKRLEDIKTGIRQVISLPDPIGELIPGNTLENGLTLSQLRVPLGVVGMIFEARPNVCVDAAVLCIKSGNAVFLRGSKDILRTNQVLVACMRTALMKLGFPQELIMLVEDTTHETAISFMRLHGYLDVLIPRGGAKLIRECVEHASVPLIETGTGNCHVYVDEYADLAIALPIILNAKTQRTSVCNACESILLHEAIVPSFAPSLIQALKQNSVRIHGDEAIIAYASDLELATQIDYGTEYLALEVSIKTVKDLSEAIHHINTYSTHHSETIITKDQAHIQRFLKEVDSACVYANASTRFSDGFEFGLGAEIGISTQKLHARGPMGLNALTSLKYIIQGDGQIRE